MASEDYEDFYDIESMTDEEVQELVREQLAEHPDIDADRVELNVSEGQVSLSGRVGTEAEFQIIEHVLTDVIGVPVQNDLVIDELVRHEQNEAADRSRRSSGPGRVRLGQHPLIGIV